MKRNQDTDEILDQTLGEIRAEQIDAAQVDEAASRVWARLSAASANAPVEAAAASVEHIHGCSDFQSLMPAYVRGELPQARALLLKDHTHECIPCRRALKLAREGKVAAAPAGTGVVRHGSPVAPVWKWAIAATFIAGLALLAWPLVQRYLPFGNSVRATVEVASGNVYKVSDTDLQALKAGETIARG
ncbi:MAG: zf-HC2 domain-containing protein, partial [Acidobacteria bacterium]|nr:zf-HC2 domain-containing protein [Acidobacteriota bacterium]